MKSGFPYKDSSLLAIGVLNIKRLFASLKLHFQTNIDSDDTAL